jgi:hypothetical protein
VPILFIFAFNCTPSNSTAMFYFYTEKLGFAPEFMGKLKLIHAIAGVLGIIIYTTWFKNTDFKKVFVFSGRTIIKI